jgi:hypothetical protein
VAALGVLGTACCHALVVFRGGYGEVESFLFISAWDSCPYAFVAALAFAFRRHLTCALLILLGSLAITAWGLSVLHLHLQPMFTPPAPGWGRLMNCAGPILELMLPIMQAVALGVAAGLAALLQGAFNEMENVPRPDKACFHHHPGIHRQYDKFLLGKGEQ